MIKKFFRKRKSPRVQAAPKPSELGEITKTLIELSRKFEDAKEKNKNEIEQQASQQRACA